MSSTRYIRTSPNLLSDLFLLAGFAVDFELRIPGYAFKCHREDLSRSSRYFANVCSGQFQEGTLGFLDLEDVQDPVVVLRMIQAIYTQAYTDEEADLPVDWRRYLERSRTEKTAVDENVQVEGEAEGQGEEEEEEEDQAPLTSPASSTSDHHHRRDHLVLHIDMYRLGEYYAIDALSAVSFCKFVGTTLHSSFSVDLLLWTVEYLYITVPSQGRETVGQKMRLRAVYLAQKCEMRLFTEPKFRDQMQRCPPFMWDYTTKCWRERYLQCRRPECEATTFDPAVVGERCDCGGQGVCQVCFEAGWYGRAREAVMCPACGEGRLDKWDLTAVHRVDVTSVDACANMFHPVKDT